MSVNERIGLSPIRRIASSAFSPAASAGWPAMTWPMRTSGCTPMEPTFSLPVACERTSTSRSSPARRT